jgi:nucleotide-binding universal stress UspA family protein
MPLMKLLKRHPLSDKHEEAVRKQVEKLRAERRKRFRVLVSLKDEESLYVVRMAARLANCPTCDIVLLYVRPVDRSGSIHVQLARRNILQAGVELPGLRILRAGLEVLERELDVKTEECETSTAQMGAWGDPVGDAKVVFTCPDGREIVLKLKVAPEIASGILDQYELGPYNLIIMGEPVRWKKSGLWLLFHHVVAEKVLAMAPCSVMIARDTLDKRGFFIYLDGSARSYNGMRRAAVLACEAGEPITLFAVAPTQEEVKQAQATVDKGREILEKLGIPVRATKVATGNVVKRIVQQGSDHLVIAITDRGRTRLQRIFFGSIASEVARLATTSVLDIRLG